MRRWSKYLTSENYYYYSHLQCIVYRLLTSKSGKVNVCCKIFLRKIENFIWRKVYNLKLKRQDVSASCNTVCLKWCHKFVTVLCIRGECSRKEHCEIAFRNKNFWRHNKNRTYRKNAEFSLWNVIILSLQLLCDVNILILSFSSVSFDRRWVRDVTINYIQLTKNVINFQ